MEKVIRFDLMSLLKEEILNASQSLDDPTRIHVSATVIPDTMILELVLSPQEFRVLLPLDFGITLVHPGRFSIDAAKNFLKELPEGFLVVDDNDPRLKNAITIPLT